MINKGHGSLSVSATSSLAGSMESFMNTLAKKCERLATAEYLVTSFLSDAEPLKARLRTLSLDLVRDASLARYGATFGEAHGMDVIRANIGETLSLLELAFISGLVSEMNFSILKREYRSLRDTIDIKKASRESRSDSILGDNFFGAPELPAKAIFGTAEQAVAPTPTPAFSTPRSVPVMSDRNPKGHITPSQISNFQIQNSAIQKTYKGHEQKQGVKESATSNVPNIQRDSRHARILKLIKDKREVAIKDIVEHFPDLSEKTIQRDLVSFTESGVLKKFGDRRWSRYSLKERL